MATLLPWLPEEDILRSEDTLQGWRDEGMRADRLQLPVVASVFLSPRLPLFSVLVPSVLP